MILKRIQDLPPRTTADFNPTDLTVLSDGTRTSKTTFQDLRRFFLDGTGLPNSEDSGILNVTGSGIFSGDLTVYGNINSTNINQISVDNLNVIDKTISLNVSGSSATANGAGIIINGDSNSALTSIIYNPSVQSKWEASGNELITSNHIQTVSNKTLVNPSISGYLQYNLPQSLYTLTGTSILIDIDRPFVIINCTNGLASIAKITSSVSGRIIAIKNVNDTIDLTINCSTGDYFDDDTSITLKYLDSVQIMADFSSSKWWIMNYTAGNSVVII